MAVRKKVTEEYREPEEFSMPLPGLPPINKSWTTPALVVLLIIASAIGGYLYGQNSYLKNGGASALLGAGANNQAAALPSANPNNPSVSTAPVVAKVDNGHFPVKGASGAKVTIVEFADFRCPFCQQTFKNVEPQLQKDYIDTGKVKMYFRQWPFLGDASTVAANAAECANDQGKFWEMHDWFYNNQPAETDTSIYTVDNLSQVAGTLGMDSSQFSTCLSAKTDSQKVTDDYSAGQKAGVSGTPTFYVNGTQLVGAQPYSSFKSAIDTALAKAQ